MRRSKRAALVLAWAALCLAPSAVLAAADPSPAPSPTVAATPTPGVPATPSPEPDTGAEGQIVDLVSQPAAFIESKAKREEVYGSIMDAIAKIRAECAKAGLKTSGPPIAVFLQADDDGFTYRAMVPLERAPDPKPALAEAVKLGQTPVGKAMKFEYRGDYDSIDSTYDAITAYLDEKGVDAQDVFIEQYLNEPKNSDDPNLAVDIYVLTR